MLRLPLSAGPLFTLALLGCGGPVSEAPAPCTDCLLDDAQNYTWVGELDAAEFALTQGQDAIIDWSNLGRDMFGDALDPLTGVSQVALLALPGMSPAEVEEGLAADTLQQADAALFVFCSPESARCRLSDFELFGNGLQVEEYFLAGTGTWLAALLTPEQTIASVVFLLPDTESHGVAVHILDRSTRLQVELDLRSLQPLTVPLGAPFAVDWSGLTVDGLGNPMTVGTLDQVLIGRYDQDPAALENRGAELLASADALWTLPTTGTRADLGPLCAAEAFCGVDDAHTWLLALSCSTCLNPAPRFVTRLVGVEPSP